MSPRRTPTLRAALILLLVPVLTVLGIGLPAFSASATQQGALSALVPAPTAPATSPAGTGEWTCSPSTDCAITGSGTAFDLTWSPKISWAPGTCASGGCPLAVMTLLSWQTPSYITSASCTGGTSVDNRQGNLDWDIYFYYPLPASTTCHIAGDLSILGTNGRGIEFQIFNMDRSHLVQVDGFRTQPTTPPTAGFTVANTGAPGAYQFASSSSDPAGEALTSAWDFGDGTTGTDSVATHTYTKPGTFTASLKVTNTDGVSATRTHDVMVAAPKLETDVSFVDATGTVLTSVSPKTGDTVKVRVTVGASSDGVGAISGIGFGSGGALAIAPSTVASIGAAVPPVPASLSLDPGQQTTFVFPAKILTAGLARFTSTPTGTDAAGNTVIGTTGQRSLSSSPLVVTMSVDPATINQDQTADGPVPVDVTVTITVTNTGDSAATAVNLRSLSATRATPGQLLGVRYKSGVEPDDISGLPIDDIPIGQSEILKAVYTVTVDGKIDFGSLVTASGANGATLRATGTVRLTVNPKYELEFRSHVVTPLLGLLPAGSAIVITGTVRNLTADATEDVGPLFAQEVGNAGVEGLSYDGVGIDPKDLAVPGALTLAPGDLKTFTLRVLTSYSEPVSDSRILGPNAPNSGGTSAVISFTPWATVHLADGTDHVTDPTTDILTSDADLSHRISIDDSITIPPINDDNVKIGELLYGAQGIWNAASGLVEGILDIPHLSKSTVLGVAQYQDKIWASFSEEQKNEFSHDAALLVASVLMANYDQAKLGLPAVQQKAQDAVYQFFAKAENAWAVGDYDTTVQMYSEVLGNAVGQVVVPWSLGKLATSGRAVEVAEATQASENAELAADAAAVSESSTPERIAATLTTVPSGAEATAATTTKLMGISGAELDALQKIATKNNFMMVVRSRAQSSLDWIAKGAMLKPEALKIKSLSALDVKLGYPAKYEGALVLKQPVPLQTLAQHGGSQDAAIQAFVESKGFTAGTAEYDNAVERTLERITEWNKYSADYQKFSKRGWIDVSFNWKGNAMTDPTVSGSGKFAGFRLQPTGEPNEFVVQMYNQRFGGGRFVNVTGDIDPIAFTHVDGTPLTVEEHAQLLNDLRRDPLLQAQHGESATYTEGGTDFIASQSKPNEALLMISPGARSPRFVRFDKAHSSWTSATNYQLLWEGAPVGFGRAEEGEAVLDEALDAADATLQPESASRAEALPLDGETNGPNVGRCSVVTTTLASLPLEMGAAGALARVVGNTLQADDADTSTCFSEGPVVTLPVRPTSTVSADVSAGVTEIPLQNISPTQHAGFAVGQQVSIDAGGSDAEVGTVSAFGSIILAAPTTHLHLAGEVVVAVTSAPAASRVAALAATGTGEGIGWETGAALLVILAGTLLHRRRRTRRRIPS